MGFGDVPKFHCSVKARIDLGSFNSAEVMFGISDVAVDTPLEDVVLHFDGPIAAAVGEAIGRMKSRVVELFAVKIDELRKAGQSCQNGMPAAFGCEASIWPSPDMFAQPASESKCLAVAKRLEDRGVDEDHAGAVAWLVLAEFGLARREDALFRECSRFNVAQAGLLVDWANRASTEQVAFASEEARKLLAPDKTPDARPSEPAVPAAVKAGGASPLEGGKHSRRVSGKELPPINAVNGVKTADETKFAGVRS